jgi:hypothetical protein
MPSCDSPIRGDEEEFQSVEKKHSIFANCSHFSTPHTQHSRVQHSTAQHIVILCGHNANKTECMEKNKVKHKKGLCKNSLAINKKLWT